MLKLKKPIKLHTGKSLCNSVDSFGERIRGNYSLMGANFTPKDLLFYLTAPAELPEDLGGMTTLVSQQSNTDISSVTFDVVNNVVNRILLDGTNEFTYQDQVYITNVLNRLGITNTEQFMSQIRRLRLENENTVYMTKLYRNELKEIIERTQKGEGAKALPISTQSKAAEDEKTAENPRVLMCMSILERLGISKIYETIHAFQQNQARSETFIARNEMRLSEHLRFGNSITLAEVKKQALSYPRVNLSHHINQYETNALLESPKDEASVLSQAAVAALVSAVDNTVTEVINRPEIRRETWMNISNAIRQSAENTLLRFESYHNETRLAPAGEIPENEAWERFASDVYEFNDFRKLIYPRIAEEENITNRHSYSEINLMHREITEESSDVYEGDEINVNRVGNVRELIRREIEKAQDASLPTSADSENIIEIAKRRAEGRKANLTHISNISEETEIFEDGDKINITQAEDVREIIHREMGKTAEKPYPQSPVGGETFEVVRREGKIEKVDLTHISNISEETEIFEDGDTNIINKAEGQSIKSEITRTVEEKSAEQDIKIENNEAFIRNVLEREIIADEKKTELRLEETLSQTEREKIYRETLMRESVSAEETDEFSPVVLTPREAEEQAPELLAMELERINEQNIMNLQKVREQIVSATPAPPPVPDTARTMRDALRSIDEPEKVMREIYSSREEVRTEHPNFSPEEEAILSLADPAMRTVYEQIIEYQKSPENVTSGILRQANSGMLQAEIKSVLEKEPAVMEHITELSETERITEEAENVLERFIHTSKNAKTVSPEPPTRKALQMVHKQEARDITEELMEQIEERRLGQNVVTESSETINREHSSTVDIRQVEKKIVTRTDEDITELVNRTLAKQMRTISDQVYRQMEKRLQTERNRRGRI